MSARGGGDRAPNVIADAPQEQGETPMVYLFSMLWYWVLLALGIGFLTGWLACSQNEQTRR